MATYSYPKEKRLRKQAQFRNCYEHGERFFSAHFVLIVVRRSSGDVQGARLGTAVSWKCCQKKQGQTSTS
jgi:ribonuclease P protein component